MEGDGKYMYVPWPTYLFLYPIARLRDLPISLIAVTLREVLHLRLLP